MDSVVIFDVSMFIKGFCVLHVVLKWLTNWELALLSSLKAYQSRNTIITNLA
jgi:hypothetical protein